MRRLLTPLVALGLLTLLARAEDKPAPTPADKALTELKASFKDAQKKYVDEINHERANLKKALDEAKGDDEKKDLTLKMTKLIPPGAGPGQEFAAKFLAFAKENAKDKTSLEALKLAMNASGGPFMGPTAKNGVWSKASPRSPPIISPIPTSAP